MVTTLDRDTERWRALSLLRRTQLWVNWPFHEDRRRLAWFLRRWQREGSFTTREWDVLVGLSHVVANGLTQQQEDY